MMELGWLGIEVMCVCVVLLVLILGRYHTCWSNLFHTGEALFAHLLVERHHNR